MADTKFKFEALKERITKMKEVLPVQLANQAQTFFVSSWSKQGWDGAGWKTPKRKIEGTPEWKYPMKKGLGRRTAATLVKTGTLRRAVGNSIRSQTFGQKGIRLVVDLPYAARHNDGSDGMPQRKFMGDSSILREKQIAKIKQFTDKVWQI